MLDNQRFIKADSRIIFLSMTIAILEVLCPPSERLSHRVKIQTCLGSCLLAETMKKGVIQNCHFMNHKAFNSKPRVFEINSSVVDDGSHLPLTSPAGPYFLCGHAKQKTGIISTQLQEVRYNQPQSGFGTCFWRHSAD